MLKHKLNFLSFIFLKDYCLGVNAVQQFMKDFNTANDNTTSEENNPRSQPRRLVDVSTKKLLPSVSWHQNVAAPKLSLNNAEGNSVHAQFDFLGKLKGWGFFPEVILDVGANRGDWAQTAYRAFSNQTHKSRVLCFEGSDNRKEDLMKLPFEFTIAVVGSKSEPIKFFDNPSANTGNSIFTEKTGFFDNVQPKTVMMWRLDDLIADKAVKEGKGAIYPQLLKIDVQGAELEVLKGARRISKHLEVILLEVSVVVYNEGAPLMVEVFAFMHRLGFEVLDLIEVHRNNGNLLLQLDFAFARRSSKWFIHMNRLAGIRGAIRS